MEMCGYIELHGGRCRIKINFTHFSYVSNVATRNFNMSTQGWYPVPSGQHCPGTGKSGHRVHLRGSGEDA